MLTRAVLLQVVPSLPQWTPTRGGTRERPTCALLRVQSSQNGCSVGIDQPCRKCLNICCCCRMQAEDPISSLVAAIHPVVHHCHTKCAPTCFWHLGYTTMTSTVLHEHPSQLLIGKGTLCRHSGKEDAEFKGEVRSNCLRLQSAAMHACFACV
jgi:hypothetical protein